MTTQQIVSAPVRVSSLPEPARRAILLARSLIAFDRAFDLEDPKREEHLTPLKDAYEHVVRAAKEEGVSIAKGESSDHWGPRGVSDKADKLWRLAIAVLQRKEALQEWHPEEVDLSQHLFSDPILSMRHRPTAIRIDVLR